MRQAVQSILSAIKGRIEAGQKANDEEQLHRLLSELEELRDHVFDR